MASVRQLVESPPLRGRLGYLARPLEDPIVDRVALVEDLAELERVARGSIALLTREASRAAGSYRFDMAVHLAHTLGIGALVLASDDVAVLTSTATAIANRTSTAILGAGPGADLAELAVAIAREIAGEAEAALVNAHAAMRAAVAHPVDGRPEAIAERCGAALGVPIALVDSPPADGHVAPVHAAARVDRWLTAPTQHGDLALAVELVLHVAASETAISLRAASAREELPVASQAEVLTELLTTVPAEQAALIRRARSLGVPIDGWHVASLFEFDAVDDARRDEQAGYRARAEFASATLRLARAAGGAWHLARAGGGAALLVRTFSEDPGPTAARQVATAIDGLIDAVRVRPPDAVLRCGVGSPHAGADGLRASAAEAKAALTAARTADRDETALAFDAVGLRRSLVEWYASSTAQEAAASVLAPLATLPSAQAERLVHTLHVYLDHHCSLARTAHAMKLHRNTVGYRVNRVLALLDVDQDNPDDLLLLQLACRARHAGVDTLPRA